MDGLSYFFSALQNGQRAKKSTIHVPYSKLANTLLEIFSKEKYIQSYQIQGQAITVTLKYEGDSPMFEQIKRISRPGRRVYCSAANVPADKFTIVSTSKGMMAGREAHSFNVGGELICEVLVAKTV